MRPHSKSTLSRWAATHANKLFTRMFNATSVSDILTLMEIDGPTANVYEFNVIDKTAHRVPSSTLEWPVLFLLSCFHRKHVLDGYRPTIREATRALGDWFNRFNWRIALSGSPDNPWRSLYSKHHPVHPVPEDLVDQNALPLLRAMHQKLWDRACYFERTFAHRHSFKHKSLF